MANLCYAAIKSQRHNELLRIINFGSGKNMDWLGTFPPVLAMTAKKNIALIRHYKTLNQTRGRSNHRKRKNNTRHSMLWRLSKNEFLTSMDQARYRMGSPDQRRLARSPVEITVSRLLTCRVVVVVQVKRILKHANFPQPSSSCFYCIVFYLCWSSAIDRFKWICKSAVSSSLVDDLVQPV